MSCERAVEENSRVVVEFPTSWRDRRRACCESWRDRRRACCESWRDRRRACCESWRDRRRACCESWRDRRRACCESWRDRRRACCHKYASGIFAGFCFVVIFSSQPSVVLVVVFCHISPTLSLEDVNIHNMVVSQNTTDSPYQVRSEFSVNLTAWNPNTVTKCFSTFRRMSVSVEYKGQVRQEVPLGFGLKPDERRTVMLDLRGDGYPLKKESALLLDLVLRNSSGAGFVFTFKSSVMRNDRKATWLTTRCDTIDRTPPNGNFSQANSTSGLAWSSCVEV